MNKKIIGAITIGTIALCGSYTIWVNASHEKTNIEVAEEEPPIIEVEDTQQTEEEIIVTESTPSGINFVELDLIEEDDYIVIFTHPECNYCNIYIKEEIEQYKNKEKSYSIYFIDLSKEENVQAWDKMQIDGVPLTHVYKNGELSKIHTGLIKNSELPLHK